MRITRGYKTELRPTVKQTKLMYQCAGVSRFAYNYGLARKIEVYAALGKHISAIDLVKNPAPFNGAGLCEQVLLD